MASTEPEPQAQPTGVMRGIGRWVLRARTSMGLVVGAVAGAIGWMLAQASEASNSLEKVINLSNASHELTEKYAQEFKSADPGKGEVLTLVLFRIRTGVHSPEIGQNLLCWLAARAQSQPSEVGATGSTSADILEFMDRNAADFPLQPIHRGWLPQLGAGPRMAAKDYCDAYLKAQKSPSATGAEPVGGDPILTVQQGSKPAGQTPEKLGPPPLPPPATVFAGVRFFLQVSGEDQRRDAAVLGADLAATPALSGIRPQGVQRVASYGGVDDLRYYKDADLPAAKTLAAHISCGGRSPSVSKVRGYETNPAVRPGTLELWIGPASPQGCKAVGATTPSS
jgi:hypothetical protein